MILWLQITLVVIGLCFLGRTAWGGKLLLIIGAGAATVLVVLFAAIIYIPAHVLWKTLQVVARGIERVKP